MFFRPLEEHSHEDELNNQNYSQSNFYHITFYDGFNEYVFNDLIMIKINIIIQKYIIRITFHW